MRLPTLNELNTSRQMVDMFKGYNHNLRIGDGEFYDMKNLTSSCYPVLSPRPKRGVYASPPNAQGLIAKDGLCCVDGADFVINENRIDMKLSTDAKDCPKQLISMGAYVIILPDKKYINTLDLTDYGGIEASFKTQNDITFELCRVNGEVYSDAVISDIEPESPTNQMLWIDTSSEPHTLKQYSSASAVWVSIATTYIRITSPGIGKSFAQYDGVTISGIKAEALQDLNGTMTVWERGDDYIVVIGILDTVITQAVSDGAVTVERKMPNMDFVTESENRLWGCRYGLALNGEVVNEIYACKLGDFKNWSCFMGISTDSYVASCGTDGPFTGAITHLGYPLFFKEQCIHKVYGNYPANYQIQTTACRGVQQGSHSSLAIVNETLFYKARNAVCAYDGSLPTEVSYALGNEAYSNAVGGSHGNKYYISMQDAKGAWHLFVYDSAYQMWHHEDNTHAIAFCSCRGDMYYIDANTGEIRTMLGSGTLDSEPVEWSFETGTMGTDSPDKKYISRLVIRMSMEIGAEVDFSIEYDSEGVWEHLFTMVGNSLRSFAVPVRPRRCDHFRLRAAGKGVTKIYSITKTIEQGSDCD